VASVHGEQVTYVKITSIGDMTPFGAPVTIDAKSGEHIALMLEEEQCRYWHSRLSKIIEALNNKEQALAG
jgi:hypothetical protein